MIWEELKKIWRPGTVLAVLLLGFVYDTLFLAFYTTDSPFDQEAAGMVQVCSDLVQTYGTDLSEEAFTQFQADIPALHKQADQYVSQSRIGKKYGLETFAQYAEFCKQAVEEAASRAVSADQDERYADAMLLHNDLCSEETDLIESRLYASYLLEQTYQIKKEYRKDLWIQSGAANSPKELEHIQTLCYGETQLWQKILPPELPQTVSRFAGALLVLICLSVGLLLSPLLVRDRLCRVQPLQYSSRRGRTIYYGQSVAAVLSTFLITTADLAVFGALFFRHGTSVFFPCSMYSFTMMRFCWPDWTHGIWCLMLAALCYLTAFATAGIVFFLSQKSRNYISMLLRVIPLAVALAVWCPKLLENAFYSDNKLYRFSGMPYIEVLSAGILFLAGCGLWLSGALRRVE